ncbi:MAG: calcium/sodium antiporter [Butyricicoccus sp.]
MMYVLLVLGFALLIQGADFFVDGASAVARRLRVPSVVIGLTIVAMGTSAPEAAVSITAGLAGNSDISLGNIVGSNLFNLLAVIGVSAVIVPVVSHEDILRRDLWWNLGVTALLFVLIWDGTISRLDGCLLLFGIVIYLVILVRSAHSSRTQEDDARIQPLWRSLLAIAVGLGMIVAGGNLVVDNASRIARTFGLSDTLIGLTIVAIGTSLPELVTSIVASRKGESGIALGNAVGSCIFNILFILGMASVLTPIHVVPELLTDTGILAVVSLLVLLLARTGRKTGRLEGALMVLCYVGYSLYIVWR